MRRPSPARAAPHRHLHDDCRARLAALAHLVEPRHWTKASHSVAVTERGLLGVGTIVYFVERLAHPGDCVVFLHRTRPRAIEGRLIKRTREGWLIWTFDGPAKKLQIDGATWCGGFQVLASMRPIAAGRPGAPGGGVRPEHQSS